MSAGQCYPRRHLPPNLSHVPATQYALPAKKRQGHKRQGKESHAHDSAQPLTPNSARAYPLLLPLRQHKWNCLQNRQYRAHGPIAQYIRLGRARQAVRQKTATVRQQNRQEFRQYLRQVRQEFRQHLRQYHPQAQTSPQILLPRRGADRERGRLRPLCTNKKREKAQFRPVSG